MNIKRLFLCIILFILNIAFIIATFVLLGFFQEKLLLPRDYILWIFKYPISILALVFVFEFGFLFYAIAFREPGYFVKRNKKWIYPILTFSNILLVYVLLFNVCVITNDRIINHSFFLPQGRVYSYNDVVSIDTGIYGKKKLTIPFADRSGEFYYIITLKDGIKIDLNGDAGGTQISQDIYEVFEKIDKTLVSMDIKKTASIDNFELFEKDLDKMYSDKIKDILNNVN